MRLPASHIHCKAAVGVYCCCAMQAAACMPSAMSVYPYARGWHVPEAMPIPGAGLFTVAGFFLARYLYL